MSDHPMANILPSFDLLSYQAGSVMAFSEVVGFGCKRLALSSPYLPEDVDVMLEAARYAADRFNTVLLVEPDLLVSKLFPRNIAEGRTVILIAHNQSVLGEYRELKELKAESDDKGNPDEIEDEIARRFGALLSYDEASIESLMAKYG